MTGTMTTPVVPGFSWQAGAAGPLLVAEALNSCARHAFTTRAFDASAGNAHGSLAALLEVPEPSLVRVRQVHGASVLYVEKENDAVSGTPADAIVVARPRAAAAVAVADCVPVLIADRGRRVVAAIHAGWRGTAAGVVGATVRAIGEHGVPPEDLVAAIGPSIGACCYQVDRPVREAFLSRRGEADAWFAPDGPDRWRLDLWAANRFALVDAGVPADAIHVAAQCTFHQPSLFHSYRREGTQAGRLFAAIRLEADRP